MNTVTKFGVIFNALRCSAGPICKRLIRKGDEGDSVFKTNRATCALMTNTPYKNADDDYLIENSSSHNTLQQN